MSVVLQFLLWIYILSSMGLMMIIILSNEKLAKGNKIFNALCVFTAPISLPIVMYIGKRRAMKKNG